MIFMGNWAMTDDALGYFKVGEHGHVLRRNKIILLVLFLFVCLHFFFTAYSSIGIIPGPSSPRPVQQIKSLQMKNTIEKPSKNDHAVETIFENIANTEITVESEISNDSEIIHHPKWIVVTSIFYPTRQIQKLSRIPGWQLLVIGDKKTPQNWTSPNVIFLDTETQLKLGYKVLEFLPWNSYTRKVIGYLYAIQHGAKFIYDTDDDNGPDDPAIFQNSFAFDRTTRGLIWTNENNNTLMNPYAHFGQRSIWPRGFPLEQIGQSFSNIYTACSINTPLIQQGMVNGDPDVDAIFRLTRKQLSSPLNIKFDSSAPPLILPASVLSPFNSQNTLFHYSAFWALLLPISTTFRVTDIWRGYWAHPLLWKIGGRLGFYPPQTTQLRNAHGYLKDFTEEDQLYKQAGQLVDMLVSWKCESLDLYSCMVDLTSDMAKEKFWSDDEIRLVKAWISDLATVGYEEPIFQVDFNKRARACVEGCVPGVVSFNGREPKSKMAAHFEKMKLPLRQFCNFSVPNATQLPKNSIAFPDILLIVEYNTPHYENIWLLDSIYRPHYPNILYCGHLSDFSSLVNFTTSENFVNAGVENFSFVHANVGGGLFSYECALRAIDMNYKVKGYLVLSDDVLWNFWNTVKYDQEKPWFPVGIMSTYNLVEKVNRDSWVGWTDYWDTYCTNAITNSLAEIYLSKNKYVEEFRIARDSFGLNNITAIHAFADFFYFPASKKEIFYEVAFILRKNQVHLEIAVPVLLTGLTAPENMVNTPGKYIWLGERNQPFNYFQTNATFLHAVKAGTITTNEITKQKYCDNYISEVLNY